MVKVCDKFVEVRNAGCAAVKFHHCKTEEACLTVYAFASPDCIEASTQSNSRETGS